MLNEHKNFEVVGEHVVCHNSYNTAILSEARFAAQEISHSEDHAWGYLNYIQGNRVVQDVFYHGKQLFTEEIA